MGAGKWFGIIMVMVEVCLMVDMASGGVLGRVVWELVFSILYCMIGLDFLISVLWIKGVLGKRYYWYCALANRVASMISGLMLST